MIIHIIISNADRSFSCSFFKLLIPIFYPSEILYVIINDCNDCRFINRYSSLPSFFSWRYNPHWGLYFTAL